jgi:hypothetical protein
MSSVKHATIATRYISVACSMKESVEKRYSYVTGVVSCVRDRQKRKHTHNRIRIYTHLATCVSDSTSYSCVCADGWTGDNCDEDLDECASFPCLHDGVCTNGANQFSCKCQVSCGQGGKNFRCLDLASFAHSLVSFPSGRLQRLHLRHKYR